MAFLDQGPVSIYVKMPYCKISLSLEAARFVLRIVRSPWNMTGTSATMLLMCLANFKATRYFKLPILRLRNLTRSYNKASYQILKRGPGQRTPLLLYFLMIRRLSVNMGSQDTPLQWRHDERDASQIPSLTIIYSTVYSRRRSKKTSNFRVTVLCAGNSPVTGEFPTQRASDVENVSILWRHHANHVNTPVPMRWPWGGG